MEKDILLNLLFSIDVIRDKFSKFSRKNVDDFIDIVAPVDTFTLRAADQSFLTFFEVSGFKELRSDSQKLSTAKNIEEELTAYLTQSGYQFQFVDVSDPALTKRKLLKSMKPSLEELKSCGFNANFMHDGYVDFLSKKGVWKNQYLVLITSPEALNATSVSSDKEAALARSDAIKETFKYASGIQTVVMGEDAKQLQKMHNVFTSDVARIFTDKEIGGFLLEQMSVDEIMVAMQESLYGVDAIDNFTPALDVPLESKKGQTRKDNEHGALLPPMCEQIVLMGFDDSGMPNHISRLGNRYVSTLVVTVPQRRGDKLKSYETFLTGLPPEISYVISQRLESEPFSKAKWKISKMYSRFTGLLPFGDNKRIKDAKIQIETMHKEKDRLYVYNSLTINVFHKDLDVLQEHAMTVRNRLNAWGSMQARFIENDKFLGIVDTSVGLTSDSHQHKFLEQFNVSLYQSCMFTQARAYSSGYLHFITENGTFAPYEEQSSKNVNYNGLYVGESGTGKSTLLSLLNFALIAKPKTDSRFKGILPIIINADVGRTSFGGNETLKTMLPDDQKHLIMSYDLNTGINSAYNIHDLQPGMTHPTESQTQFITQFLMILVCGLDINNQIVNLDQRGSFQRLVSDVYDHLAPSSNSAKTYDEAECPEPLKRAFKSYGITVNEDITYFSLADQLMDKGGDKAIRFAKFCLRFARPILADYINLFSANQGLRKKYEAMPFGNGTNFYKYFTSKLQDSIVEFPCFNSPTVIDVESARIISFEVDAVIGDDNRRSALFTGLCFMMYRNKTLTFANTPDLLKGIHKRYLPHLKKMSMVNHSLPSVFNVEEAHMFMKQFNGLLCTLERKNRKEGWGIRKFTQRITDPSDDLLSLCSTVFITSGERDSEDDGKPTPFRDRLGVNREVERSIVRDTQGDISKFVARIRTDKHVIAQPFSNKMPPEMLWSITSSTVDTTFKTLIVSKIGLENALTKMSLFIPNASIKKLVENQRLLVLSKSNGFDTVADYLENIIINDDKPSAEYIEFRDAALKTK